MQSEEYAMLEIINGLRYIATDFENQCKLLPDFAQLDFEIMNAIPMDQIDFLVEKRILSLERSEKIRDFVRVLENLDIGKVYDENVEFFKSDKRFEDIRIRAKELLKYLGYEYKIPENY